MGLNPEANPMGILVVPDDPDAHGFCLQCGVEIATVRFGRSLCTLHLLTSRPLVVHIGFFCCHQHVQDWWAEETRLLLEAQTRRADE